jgi:predicted enzyme related to lactoylglutathione lyase
MTDATPGSFVWYDLMTSDPKGAVAFYTDVIGWSSQPFGEAYTSFAGSEGPLCGTTDLPERARKMGMPPYWTSNVCVDDVDATVAEARKLGGTVLGEPIDYPKVGRLAVLADPQGATLHVFKPNQPAKVHDATRPGEFTWCELLTSDHESAFVFYSKLFGWTKVRDFDMGQMGKYLIYGNGGRDLGGMFTRSKDMPTPPMWCYYIEVADLDATVDRAKAKGAKLTNGPMEVPGGARIAQLTDPQGAAFALHAMANRG